MRIYVPVKNCQHNIQIRPCSDGQYSVYFRRPAEKEGFYFLSELMPFQYYYSESLRHFVLEVRSFATWYDEKLTKKLIRFGWCPAVPMRPFRQKDKDFDLLDM